MTIKQKLIIATAVIITALLTLAITIHCGYHYITAKASLANDFDSEVLYLQTILRGLNEVIINDGTPSSLRTEREGMESFDEIHTRLMGQVKDPDIQRIMFEEIDPEWQSIKKEIEPFLQHYVDLNDDELMIRAEKIIVKTEHIMERIKEFAKRTRAIVDQNSKLSAMVIKAIEFIFIPMLLLAMVLAYHIYRTITRPIDELTSIAEGFNNGDLSVSMDESRKDEFGVLARQFNKSIANLNQMSRQLQKRTDDIIESNIELQSEIAERKQAEEKIALAKQDWEDTFNSITDMITIHDKDFNIIRANKAAQEMLKLPDFNINEAIKCYSYYHGTDCPPEGCRSCDSLNTAKPMTFDIFEPHLNTHVEVAAIPRLDINNELVGLIHVVRDISKRKHDEELIQTQLGRMSALRQIDKAILGSMDISIVLDIFIHQVMSQLNIDAASILLLNPKTQILEYVSSKGFRSRALKYSKLQLGQSNAGRAATQRQIISILNLRENYDGFENSKYFEQENFVSYFAIPLVAKGVVKGVLEVFHRTQLDADSDWLEFLEAIADQGAIAIDNSTMFDELQRSNFDISQAYDRTIEGWSKAMDMRDKETEGHSRRVTEMTVRIAHEMGIKDEDLVHIRRGALLHDMGKLGIPDNILLKPGKLTDEEWIIMKKHPEYAFEMLYPIEHLRPALDIPYYHHEKWDGTGYPKGLKGEEIPIAARIFAVVDVWDALRSDRPYRPAWPEEKVAEHIRSLSGTHFAPDVVEVFLKLKLEIDSDEFIIADHKPTLIT